MNVNTVRFIHARRPIVTILSGHRHTSTGNVHAKGGLSVAWLVDADQNLLVSAPSICSPDDHFVRGIGADYARQNLTDGKLLLKFTKGDIIDYATNEFAAAIQNDGAFSPRAVAKMTLDHRNMLRDGNPSEFLNSAYFEGIIRDQLDTIYNGAVQKYAI